MRLLIPLVLVLILLDQVSKHWIVAHWQEFEVFPVLPFFNVVLVYNTGAAFSFLANAGGWQHYFFISVGLLASLLILGMIRQSQNTAERIGLALILSGAVGNIIDRFRLGKVVDFLDFHVAGYHFPAFNVADSAITIGVILIIIIQIFSRPTSIKSS